MADVLRSFIFVVCELILAGLLFSPFFLRTQNASPNRRKRLAIFLLGIAASIIIITAIANVVSMTARRDRVATLGATSMLTQQILRGKQVVIRFDKEACILFELGKIECESDYHGKYDPAAKRWTVSGFRKGIPAVGTFGVNTRAEEMAGRLNVWGMLSRFDDDGIIYYFNERAGTIQLNSDADL